jgi:hypothetical protein
VVGLNTNLYSIAVDSSSSLEFGAASSAADSALTIDGEQTVGFGTNRPFSSNGTIAAELVVNGVLNETYGTGVIEGFGGAVGSISGTGTIDLSNDGRLIRDAADSTAIVFSTLGPAILELEGPLPTGTISGFAPSNPVQSSSSNGNAIQVDQTVTGVSFKQTTGTLGTLTLTDGATTVGTLLFSGNYTSSLFHVDSDAASGSATITLQTASGAAGTASPSASKDTYNWTGASGGTWSTAANWQDTTSATAAKTVPGSGNAVTIVGAILAGVYTTIGGNGAAASLTVSNNVMLTNQLNITGALSVLLTSNPSSLALDAGAKLTAGSAAISTGRGNIAECSAATVGLSRRKPSFAGWSTHIRKQRMRASIQAPRSSLHPITCASRNDRKRPALTPSSPPNTSSVC